MISECKGISVQSPNVSSHYHHLFPISSRPGCPYSSHWKANDLTGNVIQAALPRAIGLRWHWGCVRTLHSCITFRPELAEFSFQL